MVCARGIVQDAVDPGAREWMEDKGVRPGTAEQRLDARGIVRRIWGDRYYTRAEATVQRVVPGATPGFVVADPPTMRVPEAAA
jgi:hypothetical protein